MTEAEWLACTDPDALLRALPGPAPPRKLRLYGCACVRGVWPLLADSRSRQAVEVVECYVDGRAGPGALDLARDAAEAAATRALYTASAGGAKDAAYAAAAVARVLAVQAPSAAFHVAAAAREVGSGETAARLQHRAWLRDLFGNLFRPVAADPAWTTPTVVHLAQAAYDERLLPAGHLDPVRLAVLADALEETGCAAADLLGHLRGPGPHVRGCWAVDLVLGKG